MDIEPWSTPMEIPENVKPFLRSYESVLTSDNVVPEPIVDEDEDEGKGKKKAKKDK